MGALDGNHVCASMPLKIQWIFHNCKERTTQNVLAPITFDLKFSYVFTGWEGNTHDFCILSDALHVQIDFEFQKVTIRTNNSYYFIYT